LGDRSAGAAVAAQASHRFDGNRALWELARVLRPGSRLALVWNVRDEETPWVRETTELIEPYRGNTPAYRSMRWLEAFDGTAAFTSPELTSFGYVHHTTVDRTYPRTSGSPGCAEAPSRVRDDRVPRPAREPPERPPLGSLNSPLHIAESVHADRAPPGVPRRPQERLR